MLQHHWLSSSVEETQALAAQLGRLAHASVDDNGFLITLEGPLGAGKTAFSQGFIGGVLPNARVRSPTFSLIETYPLANCSIHHLDLYRLQDPEELEYLGLRDLFWHSICLIEWASRGAGWLATPDLTIELQVVDARRQLFMTAQTTAGMQLLTAMIDTY